MNPKTTIGLVVALILAVLGIWWIQSPSKPDSPVGAAGPKKLLDLRAGDITAFEVKTGSASAFCFTKIDGDWTMTAPISGQAEQATVSGEVGRFAGLDYVKAIPKDDPDRPTDKMTSLADPLKIVKLTDADGKSSVLKIGKQQTLAKRRYVQKEGDETIYLVETDLNAELGRGLADYRDKRITDFNANEAVRIEFQGELSCTLVKQDAKWTIESPVQARADATAVNKLLGGVQGLRVDGFVEGEPASLRPFGLEPPRLTVEVTTEHKTLRPVEGPPTTQPAPTQYDIETKVHGATFGGTADGKVFAKLASADSRGVFQVAEAALADIRLPLDDLRDKRIAIIQPSRVQRIKIVAGADAVELTKQGSEWTIAAAADESSPTVAEFAAVDDLLKAIGSMKAIGFEQDPSPKLGLDAPRASVELTIEGQREPVKLLLGHPTPSKTGAYIRNKGEDFVAVVTAADAESLAVGPIAYLGRDILSFASDRASRIEIVRDGNTSTVERTEGRWRLTAPVEGEAEGAAVRSMLSDLSNLRGRRVVARTEDAASFGLSGPTAIETTITVEPPPPPATQPVGAAAPEPEAPTTHTIIAARHDGKAYAMKAGGATICEVDGKVLGDLEAELLDTHVLAIQSAQVTRLAFSGPSSFAFDKTGGKWTLAGEASFKTDTTKIDAILNALGAVRAKRYVAYHDADLALFGLADPNALEIEVSMATTPTVTLRLSATGPEGGARFACLASNAGRVFVIKAEDAAKIEKKVTDFQKAAP